tara:strand:+ start:291 stop:704 length:414 start_codon:yes stop_codon:yes gene_type:complete
MNKLFRSDKIEVRNSSIHGRGVFAREDIKGGEMLEECHYIVIDDGNTHDMPLYKWRRLPATNEEIDNRKFPWPTSEDFEKYTIVLGFGTIYNSVLNEEEKSVKWETDLDKDIYRFFTVKDVKKDEELLLYYHNGKFN